MKHVVDDSTPGSERIHPASARTESGLLSRRQFLRRGALAAGLATLSGVELLRPTRALAQAPGVENFDFHSGLTHAMPVYNDQNRLRLCRHIYEFDYRPAPGSQRPPDNLLATYRYNRQQPNPLQANVQDSPFDSFEAYQDLLDNSELGLDLKVTFPPPPYPAAPGDEIGRPNVVLCYRTVRRNADGRTLHVTDWCSLYSNPDRVIRIQWENQELASYDVRDVDAVPNPPPDLSNFHPEDPTKSWRSQRFKSPIDHWRYFAGNDLPGSPPMVYWDTTMNANRGNRYKVEVYIPSLQGVTLTRNAQYLVYHADSRDPVQVSLNQQTATRPWAPLRNAQNQIALFRFGAGSYRCQLKNSTGESPNSAVVLGDGIRYIRV